MSIAKAGPATPVSTPIEHVRVRGKASGFLQEATAGKYTFQVDEPVSVGGTEAAPDPYDYLLAALGACTSMTVGWYARRNQIPLEEVSVSLRHSRIHAEDCVECETKSGMLDRIDLTVQLTGPITPEQDAKLMAVAAKCPVHRTLDSEIDIRLQSA
ncbi:MAG TPA: OsmC family protein [Chthoniobacterales bacterium]|jgi:putative redox protein|nr:OsmC family protein [Chthoniobacterales bacterium]